MFECDKCQIAKEATDFYATKKLNRGHYATCKDCWDAKSRAYRLSHKESCTATRKKWATKNKARKAEITRQSALRTRYGITQVEFDAMMLRQNGACAICKKPPAACRQLCIDHCHKTGMVRALLCDNCNRGIGAFSDDPRLLIEAAAFIKAFLATEQA